MQDKIAIASDHGGRLLKSAILTHLTTNGYLIEDYGTDTHSQQSVDYPDFAKKVADAIFSNQARFGILICGTGIGMSIAANRYRHLRAALVWNEYTARMSKAHNDANVLCLGERTLHPDRAIELVDIWLSSSFEGKHHKARVDKLSELGPER